MSDFYTYLHCKPDGEPFYVGKGYGRRAYKLRQRNNAHKKVVSLYGENNIKVFIFPCESEEQSLIDERQQISQLRKEGFILVNLTSGGQGVSGYCHNVETRQKMSASAKTKIFSESHRKHLGEALKKRVITKETKEKLSKSQLGNKKWLGKYHTEESKLIMSNKIKQSWANPEIRAKRNAKQFGRILSAESRKKMSDSLKKYNAEKVKNA